MNIYLKLLKKYADGLIKLQDYSRNKKFYGGIYCTADKNIHGRCIDAVYGFTVAYKFFKNPKYLKAAEAVFDYGENLICTDGGIYNDLQTEWRFTTTFHEIDLVETYLSGKEFLSKAFKDKILERIKKCANWLFLNLDEHSYANINYATTNGLALALAGTLLKEDRYLKQAKHLIDYALEHISTNNLFYGEGKPHNAKTERGCFAIDIGYNMEESLPALTEYAFLMNDKKLQNKILPIIKAHLDFISPDGSIDNSFGCRNYKWTYWGSRTCDGCSPMFLLFAAEDPAFVQAAYRNTKLLDKCSPDGYLMGGPHYKLHRENPCTHHTFEHINALAYVVEHIDEKYLSNNKASIPSDKTWKTKYYSEMDSFRFNNSQYIADITFYDQNISYSGHASGGTLTFLFKKKGSMPLIAGSVTEYKLTESTNMQVPLDRESHQSLLPRIEIKKDGHLYATSYFTNTTYKKLSNNILEIKTGLMDIDGNQMDGYEFGLRYEITTNGVKICLSNINDELIYKLPLINGEFQINKGALVQQKDIFFLTGGFIAIEYQIKPKNGEIEIEIK